MNNYQPENPRWLNASMGNPFDDSESDNEALLFLDTADEKARRFTLISAYIDRELTNDECREVQHWLDSDPAAKKLYNQLLRLQTNLRQIPIPVSLPPSTMAEQVFQKVDRQRDRRVCFYGGAVLAAMAIGLVSHLISVRDAPMSQMANSSLNVTQEKDHLMIALNRPILEIPDINGKFSSGQQ